MILTDSKILQEIEKGTIKIEPFDPKCLGSNSYDVHLGKTLATYNDNEIDAKKDNKITYLDIPEDGLVLQPGILYLGVTQEYTETHNFLPILNGKSSIGRLGIFVHITAGFGDIGFCGNWTLELTVVKPVKVYPNMKIGQVIYFNIDGEVNNKYNKKKDAKYNNRIDKPMGSAMWKNFI